MDFKTIEQIKTEYEKVVLYQEVNLYKGWKELLYLIFKKRKSHICRLTFYIKPDTKPVLFNFQLEKMNDKIKVKSKLNYLTSKEK